MAGMLASSTTEIREAVGAFAAGFDPAALSVDDAKRMVREGAAIENTAATVKSLAAARVAQTQRWDRTDGKSAADWLAGATGTTGAKARDQIEAGRRLAELDDTAAAARRGELSADQVAAITDAAAADPSAEGRLLDTAKRGSLRDLRERCASTKAAADADPEATRRRIQAARRVRDWVDAGGVGHMHINGPVDQIARIKMAMAPHADRIFRQARAEGRQEDPAAYAFDALVALADQAAAPAEGDTGKGATGRRSSVPARFRAVLRVDYEALVRGALQDDEICEIAGIGPIPVATARELLGEATLHLVITKGVDVANVTYLGRAPTAAQRMAMLWQMPMCSVEGCARRVRLQYDHGVPFADCEETVLDNIRPLCEHHHAIKTGLGWDLAVGTGRRPMVSPDHPDHPKNRKVSGPGSGEPDAA